MLMDKIDKQWCEYIDSISGENQKASLVDYVPVENFSNNYYCELDEMTKEDFIPESQEELKRCYELQEKKKKSFWSFLK